MTRRLVAWTAGSLAVIVVLVVGLAVMISGGAISCVKDVVATTFTSFLKRPSQLANWNLINDIGLKLGASDRERAVALAVAQQESDSENVAFGDRDSLGLFQQRPSQGWGTPEQVMDPEYATTKFYQALLQVKDRDNKSPLELALAVQRPSYEAYTSPEHSFNSWIGGAVSFVQKVADGINPVLGVLTGVPTNEEVNAANDRASLCQLATDGLLDSLRDALPGLSSTGPEILGLPVANAPVTSEFGMRFHPIFHYWKLHDGIDFGAQCNAPIYAAADGVVKVAEFQQGRGNYVEIEHGGDIATGYAHQSRFAPGIQSGVEVKRGQQIGYVGTTGTSTACHLHFRTVDGGKAVNPRPFLGL